MRLARANFEGLGCFLHGVLLAWGTLARGTSCMGYPCMGYFLHGVVPVCKTLTMEASYPSPGGMPSRSSMEQICAEVRGEWQLSATRHSFGRRKSLRRPDNALTAGKGSRLARSMLLNTEQDPGLHLNTVHGADAELLSN